MSSRLACLVDSDAFIGRHYPKDPHFQEASAIFQSLEAHSIHLVTTSMVIAEAATVLSFRDGQTLARQFLQVIHESEIPIIHIDESLLYEGLRLFSEQTRRGTSVTDCTNVAVMRKFGIATIFSFDHVYPKDFGLTLAA